MNGLGPRLVILVTMAGLLVPRARSQEIFSFNRDRALSMWNQVASDIEKHYYDPQFHGLDWNATVADTKQKIKSSPSFDVALAHVAQALVSLNDSHTRFLPPPHPYFRGYGFQMAMVGERCYVIRVRPGTDAEAKGLKVGDELLGVNDYRPVRQNLWLIEYRYNVLRPDAGLRLVLRDVQGQQRQVDVKGEFDKVPRFQEATARGVRAAREWEDQRHLFRGRWAEVGDVGILKLPVFFLEQSEEEALMKKAGKHPSLIMDLRGNPGGATESLKGLLGGVFEKDVKIADRVGRKESKPEIAKTWKHGVFTGKLVVLVDSQSASASELFARVVQLEKRGLVMGDRSSWSVMEARFHVCGPGTAIKVPYGAEITEADLIMSDGKSLEHTGVTPDERVLPTAEALASGEDPVLSRAASLLGAKLTPEDAGKLFPYEWSKE